MRTVKMFIKHCAFVVRNGESGKRIILVRIYLNMKSIADKAGFAFVANLTYMKGSYDFVTGNADSVYNFVAGTADGVDDFVVRTADGVNDFVETKHASGPALYPIFYLLEHTLYL